MLILKFKYLSVTNTKKSLIPIIIKTSALHLFNKYPQKSGQKMYITRRETSLRA
jgi:hypothetical protein